MPTEKKSTLEIFVPIIPSLVWAFIVICSLVAFYTPISDFLGKATNFKWGDMEVRVENSIRKFPLEERYKTNNPELKKLALRLQKIPFRNDPYRILVAHDELINAKHLQTAISELGFVADIGICPDEIEEMLKRHLYDLVISDIDWSKCPANKNNFTGVTFLEHVHKLNIARPTIFFIHELKPEYGTPAYAQGITNNWYEVINLMLDVLAHGE